MIGEKIILLIATGFGLGRVPVTMLTLVAGFIVFRCFDILKPFPIRWFERTFSGGAGIVLDDLMAGVLAAFLLKAIYLSGVI